MFHPNLVFDEGVVSKNPTQCEKYVKGVNQVMKLHKATTIEELTIGFALPKEYSDSMNNWVQFAAKKRVQKLNLSLYSCGLNMELMEHNCLFSRDNRRLYWWRLRDCHMSKVNVDDKDIDCLLSNSPNLENLCLRDSHNIRNLRVSKARKLKCLKFCKCRWMRTLFVFASNLKDLFICSRESSYLFGITRPFLQESIWIYAPNLVSFRFCGVVTSRSPLVFRDVDQPPHLSYVSLGLMNSFRTNIDCFQELFTHFSQVKRLRLDMELKVVLDMVQRNQISHQFPHQFINLEHLEMTIKCPPREISLLWLCSLVKAAPFLSSLSIKWKDDDIPNKVNSNIRQLHHSLKVVDLVGFAGFRNQIELVLQLVEIAVSLEKIILDVRMPRDYRQDGILIYNNNHSAETCRAWAQLLRTQIRPKIDVVII
ncbi:hypothetical protein FEM48_Zijuj07G0142200 [Ziziphus jujuba var. spinosa]|uniref:At1g61320/AtMIF1 LRR domain-containing protein n=1 Tax=Ziziphus jujuba var. spinosa TaxID=714518 RepID=A0A978V538_ZIZJJ|nr:hypothetical protein FEM48_Zijuj07G0142200 [Ziziphus jujuba var. spinosa]